VSFYPVLIEVYVSCYRRHRQICGYQNFASALETDDNRLAVNACDIITVIAGSIVTALFAM
jgi:hypothetical protein